MKNSLANGSLDVWSRGTNNSWIAGSPTSPVYGPDSWDLIISGTNHASGSIALSTFPLGQIEVPGAPSSYATITASGGVGATGAAYLYQSIVQEKFFSRNSGIFSFYAKTDTPHELVVQVIRNFGTGGSAPPFQTAPQIVKTEGLQIGPTWRRHAVKIPFPTLVGAVYGPDATLEIRIYFFGDAATLGQQAINWTSTVTRIAQLQLEPGLTATEFEGDLTIVTGGGGGGGGGISGAASIIDYGADHLGVVDATGAITRAASASTTVRVKSGLYKIAQNYTIPAGVNVNFETGGKFTIDTGVTLTIAGIVTGDLSQKFTGPGLVRFPYNSLNEKVPVTWFGADPGNSADSGPAILAALNSIASGLGQEIYIPAGTYRCSSIVIPSGANRAIIKGDGFSKTVLVLTSQNVGDNALFTFTARDRVFFEGMSWTCPTNGVSGARTIGCHMIGVSADFSSEIHYTDVEITNFNKYGIWADDGAAYIYIEKCRFLTNQNTVLSGGDGTTPCCCIYCPGTSPAFLNAVNVTQSRFTSNDQVIFCRTHVTTFDGACTIEHHGQAVNPLLTPGNIIDFQNSFAVSFHGNYLESNDPAAGKYLINFDYTGGISIMGNLFACEQGGTTQTARVFRFGNQNYGIRLAGNIFVGDSGVTWITANADGEVPDARDNAFYANNGTPYTLASSIQNHVTSNYVDVKGKDKQVFCTPTDFYVNQTSGGALPIIMHQYTMDATVSNPSTGFGAIWPVTLARGDKQKTPAGSVSVTWENAQASVERSTRTWQLVKPIAGNAILFQAMRLWSYGTLEVGAGWASAIRHYAVDTTINDEEDVVVVDAAPVTITLPTIGNVANGREFTVKRLVGVVGDITVQAPSFSASIDNKLTYLLGDRLTVKKDGTTWVVVHASTRARTKHTNATYTILDVDDLIICDVAAITIHLPICGTVTTYIGENQEFTVKRLGGAAGVITVDCASGASSIDGSFAGYTLVNWATFRRDGSTVKWVIVNAG